MSAFQIRTIHDKINEERTCIIGIDRFEDIDPEEDSNSGKEYYCAALVLDGDGKPITSPNPCFGKQGSFARGPGMDIHFDDEFNLPSPQMYRLLAEALKRRGLVYNKKKCRFKKINDE